jgi:hypothetical protein
VLPEQAVTTTSFVVPFNLAQTEYVLRVRAEDDINASAWTYVNFKVRLGTLPTHNSSINTSRPTFMWSAVPGATAYTLTIDNDPVFGDDGEVLATISLGNILSYTLTTAEALPASGVYYWQVSANTLSAPTNNGSRTLYYMALTALKPTLLQTLAFGLQPATLFNEAAYYSDGVTFTWESTTVPLWYELQISTGSTFPGAGTIQYPVDTTVLILYPDALANGVKYWRVRGIYSADGGSYGPWSDTKSFTLDTVAPLPVYGTAISDTLVTGTSYTPAASLPQDNTTGYIWVVAAEDSAGNVSAPSLERTIFVFQGRTPTPAQFGTDTTPAFTWTGVTGSEAAPWTLEIARDALMTDLVYSSTTATSAISFTLPNAAALSSGLYYWRVYRSTESAGAILGQAFYLIDTLASVKSTPQEPSSGAILIAADLAEGLDLSWTSLDAVSETLPFSENYLVEVSTSSTFAAGSLVETLWVMGVPHVYWPTPDLPRGIYYWRVRGLFGPDANPGPVGTVFSFRVS